MLHIKYKLISLVLLASLLMPFIPQPALAQEPANQSPPASLHGDCSNPDLSKDCGMVGYIRMAVQALSALAGIVIVIMITVGGIQYSASKDNPQATAAAKGKITNAITALIAYLLMFGFLQYIVPGGVI